MKSSGLCDKGNGLALCWRKRLHHEQIKSALEKYIEWEEQTEENEKRS